jgi:hypothetical protein
MSTTPDSSECSDGPRDHYSDGSDESGHGDNPSDHDGDESGDSDDPDDYRIDATTKDTILAKIGITRLFKAEYAADDGEVLKLVMGLEPHGIRLVGHLHVGRYQVLIFFYPQPMLERNVVRLDSRAHRNPTVEEIRPALAKEGLLRIRYHGHDYMGYLDSLTEARWCVFHIPTDKYTYVYDYDSVPVLY